MCSTSISIAAAFVLLCAPEIHVRDGIALLAPAAKSPEGRTTIHTARGESESVWITLQNDDLARRLLTCQVAFGEINTATAQMFTIRDREKGELAILEPQTIAPGATLDLLLRLYTPPTMAPGRYEVEVALEIEDGVNLGSGFDLEVFDFSLPKVAELPVLLGLDRAAFRNSCEVTNALGEWQALYDSIADARMGVQVWPPPGTGDVFYDYSNMDQVKAHLEYAAALESLPAIEIGAEAGTLLEAWPAPVLDSPQDPLQYLLFSTMATLEGAAWEGPTVLVPAAVPPRDQWQSVRDAYARVSRADSRITRLLAAPPHPYFERYTDIWALPPGTPYPVMEALRTGRSLITYQPASLAAVQASESAQDRSFLYKTAPADAFDGAETSAWLAESAPESPWLEVAFHDRPYLESVSIIWASVEPAKEPRVETAYNPDAFSLATVDWDLRYATTASGAPVSMGTFKYPRESQAVKFVFEGQPHVAEILFNTDIRLREAQIHRSMNPVTPWLDVRSADLPTRDSTWLRAVPWYCWQAGFQGVFGPVLQPESKAPSLVSCSEGAFVPSIALFALADGLDDYEYLRRYLAGLARGTMDAPADFSPGLSQPVFSRIDSDGLAAMRDTILEQRRTIGRLLSGQRTVTRNFGPRRR